MGNHVSVDDKEIWHCPLWRGLSQEIGFARSAICKEMFKVEPMII